MEQIVDPVSRGGLPGSSTSHSPAGDEERADEPGKGGFRTFPKINKSAKVAPHSGSELSPHSSSWTAAAQLEDSLERVRLREKHAGKTYFWNRRTHSTVWQAPAGVEVVWYGEKDEVGGVCYWHRGHASVRMTSLLFLLGEERYRQPRAVYKYWVGDVPSCDHAATCSNSSSSFMARMDQKSRSSGMY